MTAFIGEIRVFPFDFPPANENTWAFCDGSLMVIEYNPALFSVLGTTYGGDGSTTFALPDLRDRVPIGFGDAGKGVAYGLGQAGGSETVILTEPQLPTHSHAWLATPGDATTGTPTPTSALAGVASDVAYQPGPVDGPVPFAPAAVGPYGGGGAHNNVQPYLVLQYCISLDGIYPSRW